MRPLVGLQMRTFGIDLLASWKLAFVYPAFGVGWAVLVASRVMPVRDRARGRARTRVRVLRARDRREAVRCHGDQSRDALRVAGGNPDDGAPPARSMKVEVVHVEHRTPARRVTGVGMTLTRAWTRRRCQDLTFALASAVLFFLDLLVFLVLFEVLARFLFEDERRTG